LNNIVTLKSQAAR